MKRSAGRRGLSLAEALLSFFLIFLVLGMAADLMAGYSNVLSFSTPKENSLTVAQVALQQMADEARESTRLLAPTASVASNELRFQKIDPNFADWIPNPVPLPPPSSWNPYPPAHMLEIRYYVFQSQLFRDSGPAGGAPQSSQAVASLIAGLETTMLPGGLLDIQIGCQEKSQIRSFHSQTLRPLP